MEAELHRDATSRLGNVQDWEIINRLEETGERVQAGAGEQLRFSGGDNRIAEDLSPLGEAAVGGQDHCAFFVARINESKEEITTAVDDRQVADLIDDE